MIRATEAAEADLPRACNDPPNNPVSFPLSVLPALFLAATELAVIPVRGFGN
jgi:hypothetical protein